MTHRVMTTPLIIMFPKVIVVEISLQFHRYYRIGHLCSVLNNSQETVLKSGKNRSFELTFFGFLKN